MNQLKKIPYEIIDRESNPSPYKIMDSLIAAHHPHLAEAKIALAWRYDTKRNKDGHLVLGKCRKASELDRQLHEYDFVITLNHEWWNLGETTGEQRRALVDHELCHADVSKDENDEPKQDEKGRPVWRIRKHDLEEFRDVVDRHGLYKADLEAFAEAAFKAARKNQPLLEGLEKAS